ncbi:hypothetical protein F993_03985 [Acinetobacter proteolyticus]|jgi:hypothetical protein|uniref:DUF2059 domain-containing protein n=1 Tax=Acinetobacter proteolyticus TaxID=1776741 RepID=A0A653K8L9_9GAMM|nr:DUF2059 domain-containing protein [Acinetobacter proteolyticus]QHH94060.1 DUF2059 domain-containing protein [Acinetobacter gyllenbergii]ENU21494.1 hypothetical protein F993_03985 [Acinetobacter proteolyticus]OEY93328.1 DUF2059 domain-containing protein [Acinetobacter proteolyticus]PKF35738.1 DUF2059 domain-containing protein [Acinetobacter proteolyticus]VXA56828.1 conserved exported hypothetical protein [Acinetobacter proteolyticus]
MNKYMFNMVIGLCLLGSIQSTCASPAQSQSVKELIKLSDLEHVLNTSLDEMQPTLDLEAENILLRVLGKEKLTTTQEHLAVLELSQLLKETSAKVFARPETLQTIEKIYADALSEEEVQAYLRFLKTPEGQSINQKTMQISTNVFQYMNNLSQKTLNDPEQSSKLQQQFLTIIQPLIQEE